MALLDTDVIGAQSAGSYQVIGYLSILSEHDTSHYHPIRVWASHEQRLYDMV